MFKTMANESKTKIGEAIKNNLHGDTENWKLKFDKMATAVSMQITAHHLLKRKFAANMQRYLEQNISGHFRSCKDLGRGLG